MILRLVAFGHGEVPLSKPVELRAVDATATPGVQMPRSEFRKIVDTLIDGVIIIDSQGTIQRANNAVEGILGYREDELLGKNVNVLMSGDDREHHNRYLAHFKHSDGSTVMGRGREVEAKHKDGTSVPLEIAVTPAEISGQTMFVGMLRDITERREYEARIKTNEKIMRAVNQALGNVISDGLSTLEVFDGALADLLSVTDSAYGFIGEILHSNDLPYLKTHAITNIAWNHETRKFYRENIARGLEFTNLDTLFGVTIRSGQRLIANDPMQDHRRGGLPKGHPPLKSYMGLPIYSGYKFLGMAGIANRKGGYDDELAQQIKPLLNALGTLIAAHQNNTSRIKAEEKLFRTQQQLKEMATNDPVTGIANRYMVVQELEMLFERSQNGENLTLLFVDVDHFKQVNDSHGHDVGDQVLKHIADTISQTLRPTDTLGRYGGEEFLVGLPGCGPQHASMIAERIRTTIDENPFYLEDGTELRLSASIGIAGSHQGWESLGALIKASDTAMYEAKSKGRNCVA